MGVVALFSALGFLIGPLLFGLCVRRVAWRLLLDGFIGVVVGGLVALHLIPEIIESAGPVVLVAVALGAVLPVVLERWVAQRAHEHTAIWLLLGLGLHVALENVALASASGAMGLAIAAHRMPVGLVVFGAVYRAYGRGLAWGSVGVLIALAVGATFAGDALVHVVAGPWVVWFQAGVAGALCHVVLAPWIHAHDHEEHAQECVQRPSSKTRAVWTLVGAVLGLSALWGVSHLGSGHAHAHAHDHGHGHEHAGHAEHAGHHGVGELADPFAHAIADHLPVALVVCIALALASLWVVPSRNGECTQCEVSL